MADVEWPLPKRDVLGDRNGPLAWVEYALFRLVVGGVSRLPWSVQQLFVKLLARIAKAFDRKRTRAAREFATQALGSAVDRERIERTVLAAWRHLFTLTLEDARFNAVVLGPRLMNHFDVQVTPDARRALDQQSGGLFVLPHVGMWEAMAAIGARIGIAPTYAVSRPPRNRPLSRFAQRTREARGYRLIPRQGAIEDLMTVVRGGGWVGLMLDQRAHGKDKTLIAPFFGRPAKCERSIALLARRLKKPIVFGATYRTERPFHYRTVVDRVLWPEQLSTLAPEAIAAAINAEMERHILAAPEQYFWLHDRYRASRRAPAERERE